MMEVYSELYEAFKEHGFWDYELTEIFEAICKEQYPNYVHKYQGAYPADQFPESLLYKEQQCFIINTKISNDGDLGHWCAFYVCKKPNEIIFFDPAGDPLIHVNASWYRLLKELEYKIHDSLSNIQNGLTNTCGVWCVFQLLDSIAQDVEGKDTRFSILVKNINNEKDIFDILIEYFGEDRLLEMVRPDNINN